ncbi:DoxX family protein [Brevibacillus choshinensis]|uniref:DoxX family protein n=1 Tax=Brevibacillus choshinensis TaxID=54911 RepID=A0ABX7FSN6_BRECH|nr:DoxX family protein [Brevibacillus choshinensis]QRG68738.1 DoxX family protein [Brevibacillus choshinensis]
MAEKKAFVALRIVTGIIFLVHGAAKLQKGMAVVAAMFGDLGLPPWLAYPVMIVETVGGLALILGIWSRWAAWSLAVIMAGAIITVKWEHGFMSQGGKSGYEFNLILLAVAGYVGLKKGEKRPD